MANERPTPRTDPEQARQRKEDKARRSRRRSRQLIGLALAILIVVGAASIVNSGYTVVKGLMEGSNDNEDYRTMFESFVYFDILPFDSLSQVPENTLKQAILWNILNNEIDTLDRNEYGEPLIPASRLDQRAAEIFGPGFSFTQHGTFRDADQDLTYVFDEETQIYAAPSTGLMPDYLPTVVEVIQESSGIRRVVMGYVATTSTDNQYIAAPDFDHPAKYMDYMMQRVGGKYYLYAVVTNTTHAAAPAASSMVPASEPASSLPPASSSQASASSAAAASSGAGLGEDPPEEKT